MLCSYYVITDIAWTDDIRLLQELSLTEAAAMHGATSRYTSNFTNTTA